MMRNTSFTRLADEAEEFAHSLELNMGSDREKLMLMAKMAVDYMEDGSGELKEFFDSCEGTGVFFSRLELLLPGDQVITSNGARIDVSGQISFEQEADLGAHVTDRELDLDGESYVVRHFVPVEYNGQVIAMLYGVIELGVLAQELPYTPYGGEAAVYIIDGMTGNFLIDTWHNEPGNIWELGSRPMAKGYNDSQLRQGLVDGESNYVVFISNTTGEHLYFYYAPLGINQWRVALSVPEDLVFADSRSIRSLLNLLLVLEGAFFIIYICWLVRYVRRETGEKQRQLDALNYIYDVEKLLFNAHEHRENIFKSLEVIAHMLPARCVAFTMITDDGPNLDYLWEAGGESELGNALLKTAEPLADYFACGHTEITAYTSQDVLTILPNVPEGTCDLAAIPIEDTDGIIRGILSAGGLVKHDGCAAMLKSVAFSFVMLCANTRTYRAMQRQGERDALTGLYNRNRYEMDFPRITSECRISLGCIFVDANGLHELNNSCGHEAGDDMLRAIAKELCTRFGAQYAYRIGGDEFVVFTIDIAETDVVYGSRAMVASLERTGYAVSAGVSWCLVPVEDLELLVKTAEKRMYFSKSEYYRNLERDRRAR